MLFLNRLAATHISHANQHPHARPQHFLLCWPRSALSTTLLCMYSSAIMLELISFMCLAILRDESVIAHRQRSPNVHDMPVTIRSNVSRDMIVPDSTG